jgi:hypothetical protein
MAAACAQSSPRVDRICSAAGRLSSVPNGVLHAQRLEPHPQRQRVAARDDCGGDAGLLQQLEPVSIQRVEALEGLARLADVQPAVRQHAIDVEERHAHRLGSQQQLGRKLQHR